MALENLLVSKINDIKIMQVEESNVAVENKKADSKKPSQVGGNPFQENSGGENKTIDLGAGVRKYTAKFYVFDVVDDDKLTDVLLKQRFCTITDKFRGKLSVYIDSYTTSKSDKFIGKTIFSISATVQDIEKTPIVNAKAQLENINEDLDEKLTTQLEDFINSVVTVAKEAGEFIDEALATIADGLELMIDLQFSVINVFNTIQAKVNRFKRLEETLDLIKQLPNDFITLVKEIAGEETAKLIEIYFATTSTGAQVRTLSEFVSEDGVINTTSTELASLSQIELQSLQKVVGANEVLNLTATIAEINEILTKEYTSEENFNKQVDLTIIRLDSTGLSSEDIITIRQTLKSFSNQSSIKTLIDYEVLEEMPLTEIIYSIYGNLDFYILLRDINNFKDNDKIIGTIKVYDVE